MDVFYPMCYEEKQLHFQVARGMKSEFDESFEDVWNAKRDENIFKYDYKWLEMKRLPGRYGFLAQLSVLRSLLKREAQPVTSTNMPFNPDYFNFNNVDRNEVLFEIIPFHWQKKEYQVNNLIYNSKLLVNLSPLGYCSSLLVYSLQKCFPQVLNFESLRMAVELVLISCKPSLRVGMNSLGAFASVNHIHFHVYHLQENLYLQFAPVRKLNGECYETVDYPAQAFVFQLLSVESVIPVLRSAMKLINWFQRENIAHNLFITRGVAFSDAPNEDNFNAVRIYIWARKPFFGIKCNAAFNPAFCELAGHLMIKDPESFETITEDEAVTILHDVCHEHFMKVKANIHKLHL